MTPFFKEHCPHFQIFVQQIWEDGNFSVRELIPTL